MKTVVTVTGIRPDFIRMSSVFREFDKRFNHIMVHTGQHFDQLLSGIFFKDMEIREPDYNLGVGGYGKEHFEQSADASIKIIKLFRDKGIKPDVVVFLGDSNSVLCAVPLKKDGIKIAHIEACMRSYDRRMAEEINRVVCDHVSDFLFAYHETYKANGIREGLAPDSIFVIPNTITEPCGEFIRKLGLYKRQSKRDCIIVDIHRPENLDVTRLQNIILFVERMAKAANVPAKMLAFGRTMEYIRRNDINLNSIVTIPLMSYTEFLQAQYDAYALVSDSGTSQEETALLNTPVIVPRDFTERPLSYFNHCSAQLIVGQFDEGNWNGCIRWCSQYNRHLIKPSTSWLYSKQGILASTGIANVLEGRI